MRKRKIGTPSSIHEPPAETPGAQSAGNVIATYDSEGEAQAALDGANSSTIGETTTVITAGTVSEVLFSMGQRVTEATSTSASLEERPFVVDGVELDEAQVRSLANLVAGCSRRGVRAPLRIPRKPIMVSTRRRSLHGSRSRFPRKPIKSRACWGLG